LIIAENLLTDAAASSILLSHGPHSVFVRHTWPGSIRPRTGAVLAA